MRTTYMAKTNEVERTWYVVDAEGQTLGRLATQIATVLRGKHKPEFTPHIDTGDFVIVINAEKVRLTGNKMNAKMYYSHSNYVGGLKSYTATQLLDRRPTRLVELAVKGMLPKNRLGRKLYTKLNVYAGSTHPHTAQQPEVLEIRK